MAQREVVEEFLIATRPLLKLLRAGRPLMQHEEDLIATKIVALRIDFNWKSSGQECLCRPPYATPSASSRES